jgi:hypothetical protein
LLFLAIIDIHGILEADIAYGEHLAHRAEAEIEVVLERL